LWIYGYENESVQASGETRAYTRESGAIDFNFCPKCGCVAYWRGNRLNEEGKRRMGVNLRLAADPAAVAAIPIRHLDGFDSWTDLPRSGQCVGDMWF